MKNLIAISGKLNSGKDTVGKIIQILTNFPEMSNERVIEHLDKKMSNNVYEIKKLADALKDCVCVILGCTREQLEDREFKEKPLGPEWNLFRTTSSYGAPDEIYISSKGWVHEYEERLTPRKILQLLGTEAGRTIIHPNIWVNATFAKYHAHHIDDGSRHGKHKFPNWIFTDLRFPNELEAVKQRDGVIIRVNRPDIITNAITGEEFVVKVHRKEHESETALDNAEFDYLIHNDDSLECLVHTVKHILKKEEII